MVTAMCCRGATRAVPVVTWGLPEQARVSGTSFNPHLSKKGDGEKEKNERKTLHRPPGKGVWLPKQPCRLRAECPQRTRDFENSYTLVFLSLYRSNVQRALASVLHTH